MIEDALAGAWPSEVGLELTADLLVQYLRLWEHTTRFQFQNGIADRVRWAWETTGDYSARSAYPAKFVGQEHDLAANFTW